MAGLVVFDENGRPFRLGDELGRGGEATVYALPEHSGFVAKIYHNGPDKEKTQKLWKMVALKNERILRLAAWPTAVLKTKHNGDVAGFAMPNIKGYKDIHLLYSPKSRIKEFPSKANWAFLIHAAANIARAFSVMHEQGHVIGDVNQSNLRVAPDSAVVSLIDCDSFQIRSEHGYFLCEVGVPLYTPPELQEKAFRNVIRTPNHDNFGLAVLVFHLLFMGRHPFAGRFSGKGDMPIEKAIYEFRFAYAKDNQRTQMEPPPNSLTLSQIPLALGDLFVRAFSPAGVNNGRPTAQQWVSSLSSLAKELKRCTINQSHEFFRSLSACPWCSIEGATGITLFLGVFLQPTASGFNLEVVWLKIQSVTRPSPAKLPDFPLLHAQIRPLPEARRAGAVRRLKGAFSIALVIVAVIAAFGFGLGAGVFWVGIVAFVVARGIWKDSGKKEQEYESAQRRAEARLGELQHRWSTQATDVMFQQKLANLTELRRRYLELPKLRQLKYQELQRNLYAFQLRKYLEKFSIWSASIPHVGDTRKAMLAAFNIESAADVTLAAVDAVPRFGEFLALQLLAWRQAIESKFVFNPDLGVDVEDVRRLDIEISKMRVDLESSLSSGVPALMSVKQQIVKARDQLILELESATRDVLQTRANAQAVRGSFRSP